MITETSCTRWATEEDLPDLSSLFPEYPLLDPKGIILFCRGEYYGACLTVNIHGNLVLMRLVGHFGPHLLRFFREGKQLLNAEGYREFTFFASGTVPSEAKLIKSFATRKEPYCFEEWKTTGPKEEGV